MPETSEPETVHISRYSSRRLYNTNASDYVTLDDVAELIRQGHDIKVTDKKTGDDLTRQILLQIITEHESQGDNVLPLNVLTDIVRSYSSNAQSFLPEFLSQSFDTFKEQQEKLLAAFQGQGGNPFDPQSAMENLSDWQKKQAEMMKSMMGGWMPQDMFPGVDDKPDTTTQPQDENQKSSDRQPSSGRDEEIEEMKRQIDMLQNKLKDL